MRIPKTVHHLWLGTALPKAFTAYRDTMCRHHSTWYSRPWNDRNSLFLTTRDIYVGARGWARKLDVVRYALPHRFGGVYVDAKFEYDRNIEELIESWASEMHRRKIAGPVRFKVISERLSLFIHKES